MIVILSYSGDQVANDVMEWLLSYGCEVKRINLEEEDYRKISVTMNDAVAEVQLQLKDGSLLNVNDVRFFFFRGGLFQAKVADYKQEGLSHRLIQTHLTYEFNTLVYFFYEAVSKKCLGSPLLYPLNKLKQLQLASECGWMIPPTLIRSTKKQVLELVEDEKDFLISKSIQENVLLQDSDAFHFDLKVNLIQPVNLPDHFFPSLFQYPLQKEMEIRTFFLDEKCYSLAMLFCSTKNQIVDYRTSTGQLRYGQYQLSYQVEDKIHKLMKKLNLNTGSIDLIKDMNGDFYFLEINPTGQIGWVSEEKIARFLLKKELNMNAYASERITH
jgi:hypothetical protein